jgi:dephospho-CoA kinase
MKVVGLTGGIACGKSAVSSELSQIYSLPIIDADEIAHRVIEPGTATYHKVVHTFGEDKDIFQEGKLPKNSASNPPIDRKKLGAIVFGDDQARRKLGSIMNGAIAWQIFLELVTHFICSTPVVILDVPLLFETGMNRICHSVVVVSVSPETQLQRLLARDKAGESDARARIASQKMTLGDKARRADIIIDNSSDRAKLKLEVKGVYPSIARLSLLHRVTSGKFCVLLVLGVVCGALLKSSGAISTEL